MDFGIISALSSNPDIIKAAITELAKSIGKVVGKSLLDPHKLDDNHFSDGNGEWLTSIAHKYIENYANRHGQLKVLGMGRPVGLDSIYTQVNFVPEFVQTFQTVNAQEEAFRNRDLSEQDHRLGMEVANNKQYLMVLGAPGMGKTTFLRKVGLEALKQNQGEYHHSCIPVFLELRNYHWDKSIGIDLQEKIAGEFQNCGLQEYQTCTEKLLEQGKLLVLFDGLDEVSTELSGQMTTAIKNLVGRYPKNRFIVSCRTAAYRSFQEFNGFTDVEISNFDIKQIHHFIDNWFKSQDRPEWGQEYWARLNSDDNRAILEIAQTPLLLTLLCILFLKQGEFPTKRATLYDRAVWTLLSEWDASKEIVRQPRYKNLDRKNKEELLTEIAYSSFSKNNLFFQQNNISRQIEQILKEILPEEKQVDGLDVLREIEQQGLLVNQHDDIYSFCDLSIHEFLAAKYIIDNDINLEDLVDRHLSDSRWRRILLFISGLRKADNLLVAIDRHLQTYINTPKLQSLLDWANQVTDTNSPEIKLLWKKVLAIANVYAIAYNNSPAKTYTYADPNAYISPTNNTQDIFYAIKKIDEYAKIAEELRIYKDINFNSLINDLVNLQSQAVKTEQSNESHRTLSKKLVEILLPAFHLNLEMVNLSRNELDSLNKYLYANWLLIECEQSAVRRTPEVWNRIEVGDRAEKLEQSIDSYQQALQLYPQTIYPTDWSSIQNNLGEAYQSRILGNRSENLEKAIACYQEVLLFLTPNLSPKDWAVTQNNLGETYRSRILGDRAENIEQSIDCHQQALQVLNPEDFPQSWTVTQNNLGEAYRNRILGDRAENLEKSISRYQQALQVLNPRSSPEEWAMTQNNLGEAYIMRLQLFGIQDHAQTIELLEELTTFFLQQYHWRNASSSYTLWAKALSGSAAVTPLLRAIDLDWQYSPDLIDTDISELAAILPRLNWQPSDLPKAWESIFNSTIETELLAKIYLNIGLIGRSEGRWQMAIDYFDAAWQIYLNSDNLQNFAQINYQLANTHHLMSNFSKAGMYYRDARRLFQSLDNQRRVAFCDHALGRLLFQIGDISQSICTFEQAIIIYKKLPDDQRDDTIESQIEDAQNYLQEINAIYLNIPIAIGI
jgi:tetratricopeptide (TPR) repeat protein/GTPase SAR1 family protein